MQENSIRCNMVALPNIVQSSEDRLVQHCILYLWHPSLARVSWAPGALAFVRPKENIIFSLFPPSPPLHLSYIKEILHKSRVVVDGPTYLYSAGISAVEAAHYVSVRLLCLSRGGGVNDRGQGSSALWWYLFQRGRLSVCNVRLEGLERNRAKLAGFLFERSENE